MTKRLKSWRKRGLLSKLWNDAQYRRCHYCGTVIFRDTAVMDHKLPLCKGGSNHHTNIALSCRSCDSEKGVQRYDVFKASKLDLKRQNLTNRN